MLTYYDHKIGRERIKRRYLWAFWAFWAGLGFGVIASLII